ncbi:MAG: beta-N-acetylhexosaminidase, partial [Bacteroidales bacterium]|nr:beta-N-acetylhexosaminidase [Bacteroidales bacterium]
MVATSCAETGKRAVEVVPYPNEVSVKAGYFEVAGADFYCCEGLDALTSDAIKAFAVKLGAVTGEESAVKDGGSRDGFIFLKDASLPEEAYELRISKKAVEVKASSFNGFNYAIQTIKQMLPAEIFGNAEAADRDWTLPCAVIKDAPRFAYRGMMLDVARHFFSIEEVKRYLDVLEVHKMNRFHWHLTDDQGWRIEIKKYPRLTEVGSIRKGTVVKKNWDQYDGIPYGGFYTQDEIREVVRYAESKGITVVPEIDLPGHMLAALTAYPELGCTGGPYEVWGRWGVADDVLCVGKEETMKFLEGVLDEVAELFPSEYIHIGGDECPKVRWE